MMEIYALITAAGRGRRIKSIFPKQFIPIAGRPLLMRTIEVIKDFDAKIKIVLVIPEEHIKLWKDLCTEFDFQIEHQIVRGGKERFNSVQNGLHFIPQDSIVLIHDGVRPLVHQDTIQRVVDKTIEKGNAVPCIVPTQTIRRIVSEGENEPLLRENLRIIQTPQGFHSNIIKLAYNQEFDAKFTDDASVLETLGYRINLVEGNYSNIKITHPADIKTAEALMVVD